MADRDRLEKGVVGSEASWNACIPATTWTKADAPEGMRRRIGGLISTEDEDLDGEVVLQDGLDLEPFLTRGFFNDNHQRGMEHLLGYPVEARRVEKGERLPDGSEAPSRGTWCEGYLLEGYEKADHIWNLATSLAKTEGARKLAFSVEGAVERRAGPGGKVVAKARVDNCAITHVPKNRKSGLSTLAKSLMAEQEEIDKAAVVGPGDGSIEPLLPESLDDGEDEKVQKSEGASAAPATEQVRELSRSEAIAWVLDRLPSASVAQATRIVDATFHRSNR